MAAQSAQQLSLGGDADLQGSLFQDTLFPEPCVDAVKLRAGTADSGHPGLAVEPPVDGASAADFEAALLADATARPRRRRDGPGPTSLGATSQQGSAPREQDPGPSDQPPAVCTADAASPGAAPCPALDSESRDDRPRWHHHSLVDPAALTPVLRHYVDLKAAHPERVLLYRLGDFYEFFFEDALLLSRLLELTLTGKEGGKGIGRVPMAGIPHHAAERYCAELVRRGLSVALCDQLEEASARGGAKGELLKRGIKIGRAHV